MTGLSFQNSVKQFFTSVFLRGMRVFVKICFFLPVRKRIVFCSYAGRQAACNPLYLYRRLLADHPGEFECIWVLKKKEDIRLLQQQGIKAVRFFSPEHIWAELTSCISVNNSVCYFPPRRGQMKVNTWHGGGCYKRIGYKERMAGKNLVNSVRNVTHFISGSRYFTDHVIREALRYHKEVLETGMPRNDIFREDTGQAREKIKLQSAKLQSKKDHFWILYAPTWRYGEPVKEPDFKRVCEAVRQRFGQAAVILYRSHYLYDTECRLDNAVDVNSCPDMQELLCSCDMLITDYSSCIWDYSFTNKPCFLFVPDLEIYEKERGFCEDIHTWGFPVCTDNEALCGAIRNYSQADFEQKMRKHHEMLGSFEHGNASQKIWERILPEALKNIHG